MKRAVALALVLAPAALPAQGVRIGAPSGQAGVSFDATRARTAETGTSRLDQFAEWLDLTLTGSVADPRVLAFSAQVRPIWNQLSGRQGLFQEAGSSDAATVTNYSLNATAFSASPITASTWLTRAAGRRPGLFGSASAFDVGRLGGTLRLRNPPLPVSVDIQRIARVDSQFFRNSPGTLIRNDILTEFGVRARNSKLFATLRRQIYDDRQGNTDQRSWLGDIDHRLAWGKGSLLLTGLHTINRAGFMPLEQARWDEHLRVQHTRIVASDWQHNQFTNDAGGAKSTGRASAGTFTATFPSGAQVALESRVISNRFPSGNRREVRALPRLALSRTAGRAVARVYTAVGYEWLRQETSDGAVTVVDERHVVDASGRFRLPPPFVDSTSIVVTDANQATVFQSGADYRVLVTGQLTEILILPLSRIVTGDTLLVDYRYDVGPSGRAAGTTSSYGATLSWRPLQLYASRDRRATRSVSGQPLVVNYDYVIAGVSGTTTYRGVSGVARAEYQRREDGAVKVNAWLFSATVSTALARSLTGSLGGSWNRQHGQHEIDDARADLALGWVRTGSVRVGLRGTFWSLRQSDTRREGFFGAGTDIEWRVGQMVTRFALSRGSWQHRSDNVQNLVSIGIIRTF